MKYFVASLYSLYLVAIAVIVWALLTSGPSHQVQRLGWVCGAGEKLDGTEYVLFVCSDETHRPYYMVHVDAETYNQFTHPMGLGYP